ncbi:hypothetical protein XELAEV_18018635mg [Xenopus laevis]|uniref:Uncharacterized protein n=1 Tax=Xenopus laevis TaxID=8355 RepID=A0A974HTT1_XENLA|nr:hypothetical protein XELAEV_18018635mg [Xenopus laevis]
MINNFKETRSFTTKIGLCKSLSELHWYADEDPHTFFPRCYYLVDEADRQAFTDDFRMTAARNILKWVLRNNGKTLQGEDVIPSQREKEENTAMCRSVANRRDHGDAVTVTEDVIEAALLACKMHLDILENKDIDNDLEPVSAAVAANWETFLCSYYQIIHHGAHIQNSEKYVEHCRSVLRKLEPVTPQLDIDGERNIWIIKPGAKARGQDIHCNDCLEDILDLVENNPALTMNMLWVAQKYIERPLLVHGTKVDLRQHFLITDWNPLTIWFYKDSFLRFSTRRFTLESLDTSIHLCNNSVQRNLSIARNCHPDVPGDKMWHSDRFKEYLRTIGKEHVWDSVIIPGMKKALIHAMQVSQGQSDYRKNSFDIFGADFMFGEDFQPWLLEINLKPDLFKYTAAMEKLVPFMYEDLLRVLIDHKNDPNCDVGAFELIYKKKEYDLRAESKYTEIWFVAETVDG